MADPIARPEFCRLLWRFASTIQHTEYDRYPDNHLFIVARKTRRGRSSGLLSFNLGRTVLRGLALSGAPPVGQHAGRIVDRILYII